MQTSIYYQPRLTTKNTGKTWLQYEEIFRSIKSEFQADVIYKEILRLISIILPADQEEALWAINDKASNMSKLFTLVHGPFGNNKQRATDVFNVVPDMQVFGLWSFKRRFNWIFLPTLKKSTRCLIRMLVTTSNTRTLLLTSLFHSMSSYLRCAV